MRKLNKTCDLSTTYFKWQQELKAEEHPEYTSSKGKYYTDIISQLLHCQNGICAYTEQFLSKTDCYDAKHWENGRYNSEKPAVSGQLEHFDSSLKKGNGWSWNNFFLVESNVNTKVKGQKAVDSILKPDDPDYDPYTKLVYNPATNEFSPHPDLSTTDYERVGKMIETLGLNFGPVVKHRQEYLDPRFKIYELTENEEAITQFPTAYAMTKAAKESGQESSILEEL